MLPCLRTSFYLNLGWCIFHIFFRYFTFWPISSFFRRSLIRKIYTALSAKIIVYLNSVPVCHFLYGFQSQNPFHFNCQFVKVITPFFVIECNQRARDINAKDDGIVSQTNRKIEVYLSLGLLQYAIIVMTNFREVSI